MSHQPECTRPHDISETPCGKQRTPGSPCDYCGNATPLDGSACPDCWTPIPENLADAKALLALGGLSVGTPRRTTACIFCGMEHDNGTACPDVYIRGGDRP